MNSFFPDSIKIWNNIGIDFHTCTSLISFKKNIPNLIRPNSRPVYGVHDLVGLERLFQLRVQLSPLKCHKNATTLSTLLVIGVIVIVHLKIQNIFYFIVLSSQHLGLSFRLQYRTFL